MLQGKKERLLADGFIKARAITKTYAKTFYFASHFLSQDKRQAVYAVYAICRLSDESVDHATGADTSERLMGVQEKIKAAYNDIVSDDPLFHAFRETVYTYNIPRKYFDDLIDGMYMDLKKNRYKDFDELYDYCYKVAGVVGLIMLKLFGYRDPRAERYAVDLGIAMQLTNILRDIKEDYERGRIYLPQDELAQNGVTEKHIADGQVTEEFIGLLRFQIQRARSYYDESAKGIPMIYDMRSRFVVTAMKEVYAGILHQIESNNYNFFERACVSTFKKFVILSNIIAKRTYQ